MKKKLVSALLCVAMIGAMLVGCSSGNNSGSDDGKSDDTSSDAAVVDDSAEVSDKLEIGRAHV